MRIIRRLACALLLSSGTAAHVPARAAEAIATAAIEAASEAAQRAEIALNDLPARGGGPPDGAVFGGHDTRIEARALGARNASDARLQAALKASGFNAILRRENVVTAQGIARGKQALDESEIHIERFLAELDDVLRLANEELRMELEPHRMLLGDTLESSFSDSYSDMLTTSEIQRHIIDVLRRMLAMLESRLGSTEIKDGTLVFSSDADAKLYNALYAEYLGTNTATAALQLRIIERMRKAMQQSMAPSDGAAAAPAP
ncbi:hypothetical protein [Janthinobacterium sp.]|uniref:hypothetical protein n=1 Tax=Janthinobacterium sp. TaxID=1871054 RepID=UPI00293D4845|nr:hypothetical protein [Janthinobacterium sp.]